MKRSILVATFLVTAAGVASANLLTTTTTVPQNPVSPLPQVQAATPDPAAAHKAMRAEVTPSVPAASPAKASTAPTALAPTVEKVAVEPRQAPVPFQMKPRPPVNLPEAKATDAKATETKPGETPVDPASADGSGEKSAKAAIEADGYKNVKVLRKGANGVWHASAQRGTTTVMLTVDASGSVSAD